MNRLSCLGDGFEQLGQEWAGGAEKVWSSVKICWQEGQRYSYMGINTPSHGLNLCLGKAFFLILITRGYLQITVIHMGYVGVGAWQASKKAYGAICNPLQQRLLASRGLVKSVGIPRPTRYSFAKVHALKLLYHSPRLPCQVHSKLPLPYQLLQSLPSSSLLHPSYPSSLSSNLAQTQPKPKPNLAQTHYTVTCTPSPVSNRASSLANRLLFSTRYRVNSIVK